MTVASTTQAPSRSQRVRAWLGEAIGPETIDDPRALRVVWLSGLVFAALCFLLSMLRYRTFHSHTFDLAFYARMGWGEAHFDGWQPIVGASVYGLHLVWALEVLGLIGAVIGQVPTLLLAQSLALGAAALPLGRIAARRLGSPWAAPFAAALLFLHPNTLHVAAGDFHPGTLAVLPIAWLMDALDRRSVEGLVLSSLGVLACREDLGLLTALAAGLFAWRTTGRARQVSLRVAALSLVYVAVFALVLLPVFGPREGSLALHFGSRGESPGGVVAHLLTHPGALIAHLSTSARLAYLPTALAPLAFLPLAAPELLVALPIVGVALISEFPTATHIDSHYFTPALPVLVATSAIGLGRLVARGRLRADGWLALPIAAAVIAAHVAGGGSPLAARFDARAFTPDGNTEAATRVVEVVGPSRSVQAPDVLLAHLSERRDVRRAPPPEGLTDFVVLDVSHRRRLRSDEDLLRTDEEPLARSWLAREDHALVLLEGDFAVLERNRSPRDGVGFAANVRSGGDPEQGEPLCACLRLADASIEGDALTLTLIAASACDSDLALRIGVGYRPRRVDLIAEGAVSPAHLRLGDVITSRHVLSERERTAIAEQGLRIGALRTSGSPPEHGDPPALDVALPR